MEWRCKWCGKPHPENDPPCDNCGHGRFERTTFRVTEGAGPEQIEWVCTECGRSHPRNSPPCSRCGNTTLERQALDYDDLDVEVDSYLDMASTGYLLAAGAVLVLAAVLALGLVGVVDLPTLGGEPTVSDVPGEADVAANLSLSAVESAYVEQVNRRRESLDHDPVRLDDPLDRTATYLNRKYVKESSPGDELPDGGRAVEAFGVECGGRIGSQVFWAEAGDGGLLDPLSEYSEAGLARAFTSSLRPDDLVLVAGQTRLGVDFHVGPDDTVFVMVVACEP